MFIQELARRTGISAKTIRYYESIGLLSPAHRATNQYRLYTEKDVELLRFIGGARSLGYSLTEITRFILARSDGSLPCQQVLDSLDARLEDIERHIEDLQMVRETLEQIRATAQARPQPPTCDEQCVCRLLTVTSVRRKTAIKEKTL